MPYVRFLLALTGVALQHDILSVRARRLMPLLAALHPDGPAAQAAQTKLLAWDARVDAGSAEAALFEAWWVKLLPAATRLLSPDKPGPPWVDARVLIPALLTPDGRFGAEPAGARDQLLANALEQAVQTLTRLLGSDQSKWSWGAVHTVDLDPVLGRLMNPAARSSAGIRGWSLGRRYRHGDGTLDRRPRSRDRRRLLHHGARRRGLGQLTAAELPGAIRRYAQPALP